MSKLSSENFKTVKNSLIALVLLTLVGSIAFAAGYLKGSNSCKSINVSKARESLELSQTASRNTAEINIEQQQKNAELQQQLNEVKDACLSTDMPADLIDLLNQ